MRIEDLLRRSSLQHGDKVALVAGGHRSTFAELDRASDGLARFLQDKGIVRGDRVIVFMENIWEVAVSVFAVAKAGAVFCLINPSTKADKFGYYLRSSEARVVIMQAKLAHVAVGAIGQAPADVLPIVTGRASDLPIRAWDFACCIAFDGAPAGPVGIDMDLAMLVYTSGSTGQPKGVMMTHRNVEAIATSVVGYLQNGPDDIILGVLPMSFGYGFYQLVTAVMVGATLVLEKSFVFPQAVLELMRQERVTGFPLVPTMAALLLRIKGLEPDCLPGLRYITSAAAALPAAHIGGLRRLFPAARIYSMYGQTECQRCTWLPPDEIDRRKGSVGIAIPNTEVFIVGEDGASVPSGEVGELVVRGPHVMQGYWRDEAATERALRPGPHHWEKVLYTGDLFRADADGYLYFVSRKDDIIKTRGEKVAPKEVEAVLHACPGIAEAVVVGVPDPVFGEAVRAIVVAEDSSLTEHDVIRHCAANLESFMVPKAVVFRDRLPLTDSGKVSRRLAAQTLELSE